MTRSWRSSSRCAAFQLALLALIAGAIGCRRAEKPDGTPLYAPFNEQRPVAVLSGRVEGGRAEVAVRSLMSGRLALRLDAVALRSEKGETISVTTQPVECILDGGKRVHVTGPAEGETTAPYTATGSFLAIPLDEPGRAMYREWAWIRRPREVAAIDAELARLDALPTCRPD